MVHFAVLSSDHLGKNGNILTLTSKFPLSNVSSLPLSPSLPLSLPSLPPSLPPFLSLPSFPPHYLTTASALFPAHPTSVVVGSLSPYSCLTVDSASGDNPVIDIGMLRIWIHCFLFERRSHLVSNLLLMTTDPPSDWPVRGQGALIQTKACRVKKRVQGDQNAYILNEVRVL